MLMLFVPVVISAVMYFVVPAAPAGAPAAPTAVHVPVAPGTIAELP